MSPYFTTRHLITSSHTAPPHTHTVSLLHTHLSFFATSHTPHYFTFIYLIYFFTCCYRTHSTSHTPIYICGLSRLNRLFALIVLKKSIATYKTCGNFTKKILCKTYLFFDFFFCEKVGDSLSLPFSFCYLMSTSPFFLFLCSSRLIPCLADILHCLAPCGCMEMQRQVRLGLRKQMLPN